MLPKWLNVFFHSVCYAGIYTVCDILVSTIVTPQRKECQVAAVLSTSLEKAVISHNTDLLYNVSLYTKENIDKVGKLVVFEDIGYRKNEQHKARIEIYKYIFVK